MLLVVRPWPLKFQTFQGPKIRRGRECQSRCRCGSRLVEDFWGAIFVDGSRGDNWMFPKIGGKTPKMDGL